MDDPSKETTIRLRVDTRSDLIRIKGHLETERGQKVNYDDTLRELIRVWQKTSHMEMSKKQQ